MSAKLSKQMQQAVDFAKANGGKLCRYPGGFWMQQGLAADSKPDYLKQGVWFGTTTTVD